MKMINHEVEETVEKLEESEKISDCAQIILEHCHLIYLETYTVRKIFEDMQQFRTDLYPIRLSEELARTILDMSLSRGEILYLLILMIADDWSVNETNRILRCYGKSIDPVDFHKLLYRAALIYENIPFIVSIAPTNKIAYGELESGLLKQLIRFKKYYSANYIFQCLEKQDKDRIIAEYGFCGLDILDGKIFVKLTKKHIDHDIFINRICERYGIERSWDRIMDFDDMTKDHMEEIFKNMNQFRIDHNLIHLSMKIDDECWQNDRILYLIMLMIEDGWLINEIIDIFQRYDDYINYSDLICSLYEATLICEKLSFIESIKLIQNMNDNYDHWYHFYRVLLEMELYESAYCVLDNLDEEKKKELIEEYGFSGIITLDGIIVYVSNIDCPYNAWRLDCYGQLVEFQQYELASDMLQKEANKEKLIELYGLCDIVTHLDGTSVIILNTDHSI